MHLLSFSGDVKLAQSDHTSVPSVPEYESSVCCSRGAGGMTASKAAS